MGASGFPAVAEGLGAAVRGWESLGGWRVRRWGIRRGWGLGVVAGGGGTGFWVSEKLRVHTTTLPFALTYLSLIWALICGGGGCSGR